MDKVKVVDKKNPKKCRYWDRGYCNCKTKCKFVHPPANCKEYIQDSKCGNKECSQRHPKACKWDQSNDGCRNDMDCLYLHKCIEES